MNNNQTKLYWIVGVGALLAVMALVVSLLNARPACVSDAGGLAGITVTGHAERTAVPDMAQVSLAVVTRRKSPGEAMADNARVCRAVIAAVRAAGAARKDIQTRSYSIQPWVKYDKDYDAKQMGYEVTNSIRVTVRKMSKISNVIDSGVRAGATSVEGLSFGVSNTNGLRDKALAAALKNARAKAQVAAKALGVKAGEPVCIVESGAEQPTLGEYRYRIMAKNSARRQISTPISPGQQRVEQDVVVTFAIR